MEQKYCKKNLLLSSTTRSFGCIQRYIQGPGEIKNVFNYGKQFGDKFMFIIDTGVFDLIKNIIESIEDKCGCEYVYESFFGECCMENVHMLAKKLLDSNCDVVFGIGGGKTLDVVKLVADEADKPRIIVPTSASSDAPAADWAALYDINGVAISGVPTKRCTEMVLADSAIIAAAPARLFAAGIADALVTWFEASANVSSMTPNYFGHVVSRAGIAIARECYKVLIEDGKKAYEAVKCKAVTPAVENVIEANILLSGVGFMNGGCAGSHGIHNGISELEDSHKALHGEKVAFGLLCELMLENASSELINETLEFLYSLDLPVTLEQLGVECNDDNLNVIVNHTVNKSFLVHREPLPITESTIKNVIIATNAMGHSFLEGKK